MKKGSKQKEKKIDTMSMDGLAQEMRVGFKEVHGSIENLAIATKKEFDSVHTKMDSGFKEVGKKIR